MASEQDGDEALRAVAERLYAGPAASFTGERTAAAKRAREAGDRDLAARIGALAKPTAAAQLLNALARRAPQEVQRVLGLGDELRTAQQEGDGPRLRELGTRRRRLLGEVAERAADLADGRRPGAAVLEEVQGTLQAALVSEEAATAVRSGRLVRALSADGLDPVDLQRAVAAPGGVPAPSAAPVDRDQVARRRARKAAEDARRQATALRQRADAARAAAESADGEVDDRERSAAATREALADAQRRLDEAEDGLRRARSTARSAHDDAVAADEDAEKAETAAAEAEAEAAADGPQDG